MNDLLITLAIILQILVIQVILNFAIIEIHIAYTLVYFSTRYNQF